MSQKMLKQHNVSNDEPHIVVKQQQIPTGDAKHEEPLP